MKLLLNVRPIYPYRKLKQKKKRHIYVKREIPLVLRVPNIQTKNPVDIREEGRIDPPPKPEL